MNRTRRQQFLLFNLHLDQVSYKGIGGLIILYLFSLLLAAVLTPITYKVMQFFDVHISSTYFHYLCQKPIGKYFDRLRWIPLILGLLCLNKPWQLLTLDKLGIQSKYWKLIIIGIIIGLFLTMSIIITQIVYCRIHLIDSISIKHLIYKIPIYLGIATIISILEDILFLGIVFRIFYSAMHPIIALTLSASLFAFMHFKPIYTLSDTASISTHVIYTFEVFLGMHSSVKLVPFINLMLLNILLGLLFLKSRSLLFPMSVHTGVVWLHLLYRKHFIITETFKFNYYLGTTLLVDNWLMGGLMIICIISTIFIYASSFKNSLEC